jgi:hypothetical protein
MFQSLIKTVANETSKGAGTYYYPSASGEEVGVGFFRSMQLALTSGTVTVTIEASNDGVNWVDITSVYDNDNGASNLTASGAITDYQNKTVPYHKMRVKVIVGTTATYRITRCVKAAQ